MTNDTTNPTSYPSIAPTPYPSLNLYPTSIPTVEIFESQKEFSSSSSSSANDNNFAATAITLSFSAFLLLMMIILFVVAYMKKFSHGYGDLDLFHSLSKMCDFESVSSSINGRHHNNANNSNNNYYDNRGRESRNDNIEYYNNYWGEEQQRSRYQHQIDASYSSSIPNQGNSNSNSILATSWTQNWLKGGFSNLHS